MQPSRAIRGVLAASAAAALLAGLSPPPASAQTFDAQRVRLPLPAYDGSLTPYTFTLAYPLMTLVYDTLMLRDADGIPRPWLARSVARSRAGRRVTIRLRDGVRWHDGRPLRAADVAFTFRYVATNDQPRFTAQLRNVASVRATGPLTVTIDLRHPSLGFDDQPLADLPILPRHRWQNLPPGRRTPAGRALGSGPYRLVRASPKLGYALRANRAYFRGAPRVREIRVPIVSDADRSFEQLRNRRVDMVPLSLPEGTATRLGATLGIALKRGPSYGGTMLVFNVRRAPFRRAAARRAVADAVDTQRLAPSVAPAVAAQGSFIHPASRWAVGPIARIEETAAAAPAAQTFGSASIRVLAPRFDPVRLQAGRQVVTALKRAGARGILVSLSRGQLNRALDGSGPHANFDAVIQSIPALVSYDPDYLTRVFGSDPRSAALNVGGFRSAAFDALARRVAVAGTSQERRQATRAELELLARDAPAIALFFAEGTFAYRAAIYDGWVFVKGTGILDKRSFVAPAPAAERDAPQEDVVTGGSDSDSDGLRLVNVISIAALAVVAILAAIAVWLRRPRYRR